MGEYLGPDAPQKVRFPIEVNTHKPFLINYQHDHMS